MGHPSSSTDSFDFHTVAVIGLGYVGLPLCRSMHRAGLQVIAVDHDPEKIKVLNQGGCYLQHFGEETVREWLDSGRFEATTDTSRLADADAVLICVPTPLKDGHQPDLSAVEATVRAIAKALVARGRSQLIVLESTTYPGTTRDVVAPILDEASVPYQLAFSPEREDPGRANMPTHQIPKLVGGVDESSTQAAVTLYRRAFEEIVPVSSAEVAEAAKLLENVYRAVNIAMVNEMKVVFDHMGINVWEVIRAAATKPFGFAPFYPGPGLGGHCIPIDPYYLAWKAEQVGTEAKFVRLAGEVNAAMPARVVARTLEALKERESAPWRILVLGLAYKPNIDDVRESPSFELIRLFREAGCDAVDYSDPHVPRTHPMRHYGDWGLESVPINKETLGSYDAVIVSTAHDAFDWPLIARHASLIVDTRNAMASYPEAKVIRA